MALLLKVSFVTEKKEALTNWQFSRKLFDCKMKGKKTEICKSDDLVLTKLTLIHIQMFLSYEKLLYFIKNGT